RLPPQGLGWLTLGWATPTGLSRDRAVLCRIESEGRTWQEQHVPGWGARPSASWKPGEELEEGVLVIPGYARGRAAAPAVLSISVADLAPDSGTDGFARVATFELPLPEGRP